MLQMRAQAWAKPSCVSFRSSQHRSVRPAVPNAWASATRQQASIFLDLVPDFPDAASVSCYIRFLATHAARCSRRDCASRCTAASPPRIRGGEPYAGSARTGSHTVFAYACMSCNRPASVFTAGYAVYGHAGIALAQLWSWGRSVASGPDASPHQKPEYGTP
jgi:hypothetical protein